MFIIYVIVVSIKCFLSFSPFIIFLCLHVSSLFSLYTILFFTIFLCYNFFNTMMPEKFFEEMKKMFVSDENDELIININKTQKKNNCKTQKKYIKASDILTLFEITKLAYNNILVRRKQTCI